MEESVSTFLKVPATAGVRGMMAELSPVGL